MRIITGLSVTFGEPSFVIAVANFIADSVLAPPMIAIGCGNLVISLPTISYSSSVRYQDQINDLDFQVNLIAGIVLGFEGNAPRESMLMS